MKCGDLSFYMCKFFNDTLTEYEKKDLAFHLSICKKCKKHVMIILPTLVCMDKYLKEDLISDNVSSWIINEVQTNKEIKQVSITTLKPRVLL